MEFVKESGSSRIYGITSREVVRMHRDADEMLTGTLGAGSDERGFCEGIAGYVRPDKHLARIVISLDSGAPDAAYVEELAGGNVGLQFVDDALFVSGLWKRSCARSWI